MPKHYLEGKEFVSTNAAFGGGLELEENVVTV